MTDDNSNRSVVDRAASVGQTLEKLSVLADTLAVVGQDEAARNVQSAAEYLRKGLHDSPPNR